MAVAVIGTVLVLSLVIARPAMPKRIQLLTGPEGSAYHALGLRYASSLAARGLEAEVVVLAAGTRAGALCRPLGVATWETSAALKDFRIRKLTDEEIKEAAKAKE